MENAEQRYESRLYSMHLKLPLYSCLRLECNALHGAMGSTVILCNIFYNAHYRILQLQTIMSGL